MSTVIDNRVVEMEFDNKQFEKGIEQSLESLDKLEKKLNLEGVSDGLKLLEKTDNQISMDNTRNAFKSVYNEATQLGEYIKREFTQKVANKIINTFERTVKSLTLDPISTGFTEYETKIDSVHTIMANTGEDIETVSNALDVLNHYADKTIYNFADMTKNLGYFAVAGQDLEQSITAVQGMSNLAALQGVDKNKASNAIYQLSQAFSAGSVRAQDWRSLVNAGIAGSKMQDVLTQIGDLRATSSNNTASAAINKKGNFRDSLVTGWLTNEVMLEALQIYQGKPDEGYLDYQIEKIQNEQWFISLSKEEQEREIANLEEQYKLGNVNEEQVKDYWKIKKGYTQEQADEFWELGLEAKRAATEVRSFSKLMDTLKESAQSGWTQTWEILFGNAEEAAQMWTAVSEAVSGVLDRISEARNNWLLNVLNGGTEEGYELERSLENSRKQFNSLSEEEQKKELDRIKAKQAAQEAEIKANKSKEISLENQLTMEEEFLLLTKEEQDAELDYIAGQSTGRQTLIESFEHLWNLALNVGNAIKLAFRDAFGVFEGSGTIAAIAKVRDYIASLEEAFGTVMLTSGRRGPSYLYDNGSLAYRFTKFLSGVLSVGKLVISTVTKIWGAVSRVFLNVANSDATSILEWIGNTLTNIVNAIEGSEVIDIVIDNAVELATNLLGVMSEIFTLIKPGIDWFIRMAGVVMDVIGQIVGTVTAFVTGNTAEIGTNMLLGVWEGIKTGASLLWNGIKTVFLTLIDIVKDLLGIHSPSTVFAEIGRFIVEGLWGGIKKAWAWLKTNVAAFATWVWSFAKKLFQKQTWVDIGKWFAEAFGNVKNWFSTNKTVGAVGNFFADLWTKIKNFAVKYAGIIWNGIKSIFTKDTWEKIKGWLGTVNKKVVKPIGGFFKNVWNSVWTWFSNTKFGSTIINVFRSVWSSVTDFLNTNPIAQSLINFFKTAWTTITGFFKSNNLGGVWSLIKEWLFGGKSIGEIIGSTISTLGDVLSSIINFIVGSFGNLSPLFDSALTIITKVIEYISEIVNTLFSKDKGLGELLDELLEHAQTIASIFVALNINRWVTNVTNSFEAISKSVNNLAKAKKLEAKRKMFISLGVALAAFAFAVVSIANLATTISKAEDMKKMWKALLYIGVIVGGLVLVSLAMAKIANIKGAVKGAFSLLAITLALNLVLVAVFSLTKIMDSGSMSKDFAVKLAILGGIMLGIGLLAAVVSRIGSKAKNENKHFGSILGMALALLPIIVALSLLTKFMNKNKNKPGAIAAAIGALVVVLLALGGAVGLMKGGKVQPKVLLNLAVSIAILAVVGAALSKVKWKTLLEGAEKLGIVLAELFVAAAIVRFIDKTSEKGLKNLYGVLVALLLVIGSLRLAMYLFNGIEEDRIAIIAGVITGMVGALELIALLSNIKLKNSSSFGEKLGSIVPVIMVLAGVTAALRIVGDMKRDPKKAAITIGGLSGVMTAITKVMTSIGKGLKKEDSKNLMIQAGTAIGLCLGIAGAIALASKASTGKIIAFGTVATAIGITLTKLLKALSGLDFKTSLKAAGGIAVGIVAVVGTIGALTVALGELDKLVGEGEIAKLLQGGTDILTLIGKAIGGFFGGIVGGALEVTSGAIVTVADNLTKFKEHSEGFFNPETGFFKMVGKITSESVSRFTEIVGALAEFSLSYITIDSALTGFGASVLMFSSQMAIANPEKLIGRTDNMLSVLDKIGAWFSKDNSEYTNLLSMNLISPVRKMTRMASSFAIYIETLPEKDQTDIDNQDNMLDMISRLVEPGEGKKSLSDLVTSINGLEIDKFTTQLTDIGAAISLYNTMVNSGEFKTQEGDPIEINDEALDTAMALLEQLSISLPQKTKELTESIGKVSDVNRFALSIPKLGAALKNFGENVKGIDLGAVGSSAIALSVLSQIWTNIGTVKNAVAYVKDESATINKSNIETFQEDIVALGSALKLYGEEVKDVNIGQSLKTVILFNSLYTLYSAIKGESSEVKSKGITLPELIGGIVLGLELPDEDLRLQKFNEGIVSIATGMATFSSIIDGTAENSPGVDIERTKKAIDVLGQLINQTSRLNPNSENSVGLESDWLQFASDLLAAFSNKVAEYGNGISSLGEALKTFITETSSIEEYDDTKVQYAIEVLSGILDAFNGVSLTRLISSVGKFENNFDLAKIVLLAKEKGSGLSIENVGATLMSDLESIGKGIKTILPAITKFIADSSGIENLSDTNVKTALSAVESIVRIFNNLILPVEEDIVGSLHISGKKFATKGLFKTLIDNFSKSNELFGADFTGKFYTSFKDFAKGISDIIGSIKDLFLDLDKSGSSDPIGDLDKIAESIGKILTAIEKLPEETLVKAEAGAGGAKLNHKESSGSGKTKAGGGGGELEFELEAHASIEAYSTAITNVFKDIQELYNKVTTGDISTADSLITSIGEAVNKIGTSISTLPLEERNSVDVTAAGGGGGWKNFGLGGGYVSVKTENEEYVNIESYTEAVTGLAEGLEKFIEKTGELSGKEAGILASSTIIQSIGGMLSDLPLKKTNEISGGVGAFISTGLGAAPFAWANWRKEVYLSLDEVIKTINGDEDHEGLGDAIARFANAVEPYEKELDTAQKALPILDSISTLVSSLGVKMSVTDEFLGLYKSTETKNFTLGDVAKDFDDFADGIGQFALALVQIDENGKKKYVGALEDISKNSNLLAGVEAINGIISELLKPITDLYNTNGQVNVKDYSLKSIAEDYSSIAEGLSNFAKTITDNSINFTGLNDKQVERVEEFILMLSEFFEMTSYLYNDYIFDVSAYEYEVLNLMGIYGSTFSTFIDAIVPAIEGIKDKINAEDSDLTEVAEFLTAVYGLANIIVGLVHDSGVSKESVGESIAYVGDFLTSLSEAIKNNDINVSDFIGTGFANLAESFKDQLYNSFVDVFTNGDTGFETSVTATIADSLSCILTDDYSAYGAAIETGTALAGLISEGFCSYDFSTDIANTFSFMLTSAKDRIRPDIAEFYTIGRQAGNGFVKGIRGTSSSVSMAVTGLMSTAKSAATKSLAIASPSKVFAEYGMYTVKGYAKGLEDYAYLAGNAVEDVTGAALEGAEYTFGRLSSIIASDIDAQPTIRPVLDLSDVSIGAQKLNGMLPGSRMLDFELSTRQANEISRARASSIQNGEIIDAINSVNERLDTLSDAMTNMQIVMDNGTLVGQLSDGMNRSLGRQAMRDRRRGR